MILGSHNSWSYLPVRKWWMRPIAFMARCQSVDIRTQYEMGVRCFDLRIRFNNEEITVVAHGIVEYIMMSEGIWDDLKWLDEKGDCYVRVLHEVRTQEQYTKSAVANFSYMCKTMENYCPHIHWWCGCNLYDWKKDYDFGDDPYCDEKYGSVSDMKWLYGWWPWLYARLHNRKNLKEGSEGILLIDYVNTK